MSFHSKNNKVRCHLRFTGCESLPKTALVYYAKGYSALISRIFTINRLLSYVAQFWWARVMLVHFYARFFCFGDSGWIFKVK